MSVFRPSLELRAIFNVRLSTKPRVKSNIQCPSFDQASVKSNIQCLSFDLDPGWEQYSMSVFRPSLELRAIFNVRLSTKPRLRGIFNVRLSTKPRVKSNIQCPSFDQASVKSNIQCPSFDQASSWEQYSMSVFRPSLELRAIFNVRLSTKPRVKSNIQCPSFDQASS